MDFSDLPKLVTWIVNFAIVGVGILSMKRLKFPTSEIIKVAGCSFVVAWLTAWLIAPYGLFPYLMTIGFMTVAMNYVMKVNTGILGPDYTMPKGDRVGMFVVGAVMVVHLWWTLPPFFYGGLLWACAIGTLLFAAFAYRPRKE